ncbi:dihydroorotate dehydrogenase electron transfer subunit [Geofilum sp. OHC36d9]|uniref:dihydroorotate dehydrogenase electron transfer subunit n=1 Tax=Geofilum sp. OHC36d9 TaxID=3458413 RepID=UPI00403338F3
MKYQHDFTVVDNERQTHDFVVLTLQASQILPEILPGQFAEVLAPHPQAYLRRPLSIHDVDYEKKQIKLLIQEVGKGTESLTKLEIGNRVNMIYPLGKGYDLPDSKRVLLVGGGCGVAPLLYLGRYLKKNGIMPRFLIGTRTKSALVRLDAYRELGDVMVTTEDGSYGTKGFVINHPVMRTQQPDFDWIYTCGPEAMMRILAKYATNHQLTCQVSLENHMACGIGACLCCVTNTRDGHKCTCTDGPVFDSKYLLW